MRSGTKKRPNLKGLTFATFLMMVGGLISCSSMPSGMQLSYIDKIKEPKLNFKDSGDHCLSNDEVNGLAKYFIKVREYQELSNSMVDAINE